MKKKSKKNPKKIKSIFFKFFIHHIILFGLCLLLRHAKSQFQIDKQKFQLPPRSQSL